MAYRGRRSFMWQKREMRPYGPEQDMLHFPAKYKSYIRSKEQKRERLSPPLRYRFYIRSEIERRIEYNVTNGLGYSQLYPRGEPRHITQDELKLHLTDLESAVKGEYLIRSERIDADNPYMRFAI